MAVARRTLRTSQAVTLVALVLLAACGGDAKSQLCGVPGAGNDCVACGFDVVAGDMACAAAYGSVQAGCAAICRGLGCQEWCPGTCSSAPDLGGCSVGSGNCFFQRNIDAGPDGIGPPGGPDQHLVCDEACGVAGGCRGCVYSEECEAEYGAGWSCSRHCGLCFAAGEPSCI